MRYAPMVDKRFAQTVRVEVRVSGRHAARRLLQSLKRNGVRDVEPVRLESTDRWVFYVPLSRQMPIYRLRAIVNRIEDARIA